MEDFWINPNFHPYFIKVDAELAGFVLVKCNMESVNTIAEFFVIKKFEGKGVGKTVAKRVFDTFKGQWIITQAEKNYPAQAFWRSVISEYTEEISKNGMMNVGDQYKNLTIFLIDNTSQSVGIFYFDLLKSRIRPILF